MRLLFITQKIDRYDDVLGFVHGWLNHLSKVFENIYVVCLEKGKVDLPNNVEVFSLGKEGGRSRIKYMWRFFKYIFSLRNKYNGVFVHMNPEYVILGAIFWRLWNKKIVLWYNHTYGTWRAKAGMALAHTVCHTSQYSFTSGIRKSRIMPTGIDTERFRPRDDSERIENSILYLGRISPVKDMGTLLDAAVILDKENFNFVLDVYGEAFPRDEEYFKDMKDKAGTLVKKGKVKFCGAVSNIDAPKIFSTHEVSVNLTPAGNFDKTVFETMACGSLPMASSKAFEYILPPEYRFKEKDPRDLADKIKNILNFGNEAKRSRGDKFRQFVVEKHSMNKLVSLISDVFKK